MTKRTAPSRHWQCPACGGKEYPTTAYRRVVLAAHKHRCAVAEGAVPSTPTIRETWRVVAKHAGWKKPPAVPKVIFTLRGNGCGFALRREAVVSLRAHPACVYSTLLHELVHVALPATPENRLHGPLYNNTLLACARDLILPFTPVGITLYGYALSRRIDQLAVELSP